jgi:hypothetical protein
LRLARFRLNKTPKEKTPLSWAVVAKRKNQQPFNVRALKSQKSVPVKRQKYIGIDARQATNVLVVRVAKA